MKAGYFINIKKCSFCGSNKTQHSGDDKKFIRVCMACQGVEIEGGTISGETFSYKNKNT